MIAKSVMVHYDARENRRTIAVVMHGTVMTMRQSDRSPLKARPLRVAGQSLDRQISDIVDDQLVAPFLACLMLLVLAGLEWYRYFVPIQPRPLLHTVIALGATAYTAWRYRAVFRRLKMLRLGRDGERAVAEILERMRERGFRVFHDVIAPNFNVDHLLVGSKGVFAIETKTISKPRNGNAVVEFDGESIKVGGYEPDRDALAQARAIARWVREMVRESSGRNVDVRPVVLFPGWFIENKARTSPQVWVLEPKALSSFIEHESDRMSSEDVHLVSFHISRYVRAEQARQTG